MTTVDAPPRALRVALTQFHAGSEVAANLAVAVDLIRAASAERPDMVLLPENCLCIGTNEQMRDAALREWGPEISALRDAARQAGTTVLLGGYKRRVAGDELVRNTAAVIAPDGQVAANYDKIHLFDANVGGVRFRASSVERGGDRPLIAEIAGVRVGVTICYDVRFPDLYRTLALAGAEVVVVPSAFTRTTGAAHWETLLRARAIENGVFVVASATIGRPGDAFETHGHAMVIDPWGSVLVDLGERECAWLAVTLDMSRVAEARHRLPVLDGVRPASTATPEVVGVSPVRDRGAQA